MKFDFNKINIETQLGLFRDTSVITYLQSTLEYLITHNKNYTKTQYNYLLDIKSIIDNIKE